MNFLWNHKIKVLFFLVFLFIFSCYCLVNTKIFFDTERIINEISNETELSKQIEDENLIFFGISVDNKLEYADYLNLKEIHNEIKNYSSTKRVSSIINERKIINTGLFKLPKKILNLSSEEEFVKSINNTDFSQSNFIDSSKTKLFFVIEAKKNLSVHDRNSLIKDLRDVELENTRSEIFVSGRIPSEVYFQKKVIKEFIILTVLSAILCCLLLFFLTSNIKLLFFIVFSVIMSIVITLGFSSVIYSGLEMIMIISPAILFIVCISDAMHYLSNQESYYADKLIFFKHRINIIGKAILLTSFTTSISFLTFLFNDIVPIARFGIITSFGILLTLVVVTVVYAISIDYNFNKVKEHRLLKILIDNTINFCLSEKKNKFHSIVLIAIIMGLISVKNIKIDNFLTDEVNEKSQMYTEVSFFDKFFGGIKPIHFEITNITNSNEKINDFVKDLSNNGIRTDVSNIDISNDLLSKRFPVYKELESDYLLMCRMSDIGSHKTNQIIDKLLVKYKNELMINVGGVGYVFDNISYDLTKKLIFGLLLAVSSIGLIFFILTKFNLYFLIISIIPNIVPIVITMGIMQFFNFYFSLSNAFIFTIVFGLIVDDSIHVISAYLRRVQNNSETIEQVVKTTGKAVIKTTLVIIFCLFPLIFSEFKSVSQLGTITIIAAIVAVFFDLIYLPKMLNIKQS